MSDDKGRNSDLETTRPARRTIEDRLRQMWRRSDEIFNTLQPQALHDQPISLRHPVIFYLGHLPAFAWNQVCRGMLGQSSFHPDFDDLFERGIDPTGVDHHACGKNWPSTAEVMAYRDRIRDALLDSAGAVRALSDSNILAANDRIFEVVIEHELMHQETLQYMFQQLPCRAKRRPDDLPSLVFHGAAAEEHISIGGGPVHLGANFDEIPFGWDNEFPCHRTSVDDFTIDRTPVRVSRYLEFMDDGGYGRPELWTNDDWAWRARLEILGPSLWSLRNGEWFYDTLFGRVHIEDAADWPVQVSLAEARAYCRWAGSRLPTEAEFHRAAYSTPEGLMRPFPWGHDPPTTIHGNFDFSHWAPTPVGSFPGGDSAWGVSELVGNGWEWTSSPFVPFPGFRAYISSYPGYSADFFDDRHFVMLGASWATPAGLIRRSFRNWFQDHYPFVFASFRCVRG